MKTIENGCTHFVEANETKRTVRIVADIMKYKSLMDQVVLEES